jgi:heme-degrading monooxygenase HmoA
VIARVWHGWTKSEDANGYEQLLLGEVLPGIGEIGGFAGFELLRGEEADGEVPFVTVTFFESYDAVRAFAGEDYEKAVIPPEAQRLLKRYDERSQHYELIQRSPLVI